MLGQTESIRTQDLTQDLTQDPLVTDAEPLPFAKKGYRMLQVASNFTNSTHMGGSSWDDPQVTIGFNLFQY